MTDEMSVDHRTEETTQNFSSVHIAHGQPRRNGRPPISLSDIYRKFLQYYKLPSKAKVKRGDADSDELVENEKGQKIRKLKKKLIRRSTTLPNLPNYLKL